MVIIITIIEMIHFFKFITIKLGVETGIKREKRL